MSKCGSCTLCCKLTDVPELLKVPYKWCVSCIPGKGCRSYAARPESCKEFKCFWLAEGWPPDLRPDRCRVMFEALPGVSTILAMVEPSRPDAWKKPGIIEVIKKLTGKGRPVVVVDGGKKHPTFLPTGRTREEVGTEIDEALRIYNGRSELYDRPQHI